MAQASRTSGSAVASAPDEERIVAPRRPSSLLVRAATYLRTARHRMNRAAMNGTNR
ncbi:hypothetical protein DO62_5988 [Burkholderia pseudomallei]|nr:hypothetical protein DO62_5988 [Burkholderia pseudomallei]